MAWNKKNGSERKKMNRNVKQVEISFDLGYHQLFEVNAGIRSRRGEDD